MNYKLGGLFVYFSVIFSTSASNKQSFFKSIADSTIRHYQQEANYRNAAAGNVPVHLVNYNINKGGIPLKRLNCVRIELNDTRSDRDIIAKLEAGQFILKDDNTNTIFMSNKGSELNKLTNTKERSN